MKLFSLPILVLASFVLARPLSAQMEYRYEVLLEATDSIVALKNAALNSAGTAVVCARVGGLGGSGAVLKLQGGEVSEVIPAGTGNGGDFSYPRLAENGDVLAFQGPLLWHWDESQAVLRSTSLSHGVYTDMNEAGEVVFTVLGSGDVWLWKEGTLQQRYDFINYASTPYNFLDVAIDDQGDVFGIAVSYLPWSGADWGLVLVQLPTSGGEQLLAVSPASAFQDGPRFGGDLLEESGGELLYAEYVYQSGAPTNLQWLVRRDLATGVTTNYSFGPNMAFSAIDFYQQGPSFDHLAGIAIRGVSASDGAGIFSVASPTHEQVYLDSSCAAGGSPGLVQFSQDAIDSSGRVVFTQAGQVVLATPIAHSAPPGNSTCVSTTSPPCPTCAAGGGCRAGCPNSSGQGANLEGYGSSSLGADDLEFQASGLPPHAPALLFAGSILIGGGTGQAFGNGIRCASGSVVRLGVQFANGVGSAAWNGGALVATGATPGVTRIFQVWYRDPHSAPACPANFNLSGAYQVVAQP